MSEREARALGAGTTISANGETFTLRPVSVQNLADLEREALRHYKRQYLETFAENSDLLRGMNVDPDKLLRDEFEKVAGWSLDDVPKKTAFDVSGVPINDEVTRWAVEYKARVESEIEDGGRTDDEPLTERRTRALLAAALDQERLSPEDLKRMAGRGPRMGRIRYDQWWVTGCFEGMIAFIHGAIKREHPEMTRERIGEWSPLSIFEAARVAESVTAPDPKNGRGPST